MSSGIELQNLKSPIGSTYRFRKLFKVAKIIIITPHSNAGVERVYSLVNKTKPEKSDCNCPDVNRSLSSILADPIIVILLHFYYAL